MIERNYNRTVFISRFLRVLDVAESRLAKTLRVVVAVAVLCLLAGHTAQSQQADPISALQPGEWYRVPNSKLSAVLPKPVPPGWTGPASIIGAWNSAALDTKRDRLLVWGGGHADYAGNEIYAFDIGSLTWSRIWGPSADIPTSGAWEAYSDSNPSSRHTYDGLTYIPTVDRLFSSNGSPAWVGNGSAATWLFNLSSSTWERGVNTPAGSITSNAAYDPVTQHVFHQGNTIFAEYNPTANTYTRRGTVSGGMWSNPTGAIDPVRRLFVMVGSGKVRVWNLNNWRFSDQRTTDGSAVISKAAPGFKYDPVRQTFIAWAGGTSVWELNPSTWKWTEIPAASTNTVTPTNPAVNGTFSRWQYVPSRNVYIVVNGINEDVYFYKLSSGAGKASAAVEQAAPASAALAAAAAAAPRQPEPSREANSQQASRPGSGATSFTLTSRANQTMAPFTIGLAFKKAAVAGTPVLDIPDQQVVVKKRWNDGSVKHAIASGHVTLSANRSRTITASDSATPRVNGLTAADIRAAGPTASVQLGGLGTVQLSPLLEAPFRTWISGPEMVEAHYRSGVGSDPSLAVWFHVRLYKNGRVWVRAIAENGAVNARTANTSYVPLVSIGGARVYDNGGAALTHYAHTRWSAEGWIGGDPQITPRHDVIYLMDTKLVPNYWKRNPSSATLNNLYQNYVPMKNGGLTPGMGAGGFQNQLGLLPLWDALYVTTGDARAYRATLAHSSAMNSYPIVWRDANTNQIARPSDHPNYSVDGGTYQYSAGPLTWEMNHAPSEGYLAYLISGDYWHYETMLMQTSLDYLAINFGRGRGVNRILIAETRGAAWNIRNFAQTLALAPDDDLVAEDYRILLANNMNHWKSVKDSLNGMGLGYLYEYNLAGYAVGTNAPWMQHFFIQSVGMGSDIEPLPNMTAWNEVRDWLYRGVVGILGDASGYCFTHASNYTAKISAGTSTNPSSWYPDWKTVFVNTHGNAPCRNTLAGTSGGHPTAAATGFWGNLIPAIAYAVDHGAPGAAAAWARLTGASNWSIVESSGFDNIPNWGIVPRSSRQTRPN